MWLPRPANERRSRERLTKVLLCRDLLGDSKADGGSGAARDCGFRVFDSAEENAAEPAGGIVIKAQVRVLFHYVKRVAKFGHELRIRSGIHDNRYSTPRRRAR